MSDETDLFEDDRTHRRVRGQKAPVLVVFGAAGGLGATTTALMISELAVTVGSIPRVVLVDARTGRSDIRTWLSISDKVPSLSTAVISSDPRRALADANVINGNRPASVNNIGFGVITSTADETVKPETVLGAIDAARLVTDLVVVDAGVCDTNQNSTYTSIALPLLLSGAWGLMVTQMGRIQLPVTLRTLGDLKAAHNVGRDRLAFLINRNDPAFTSSKMKNGHTRMGEFTSRVLPMAQSIGVVDEDHAGIGAVMVSGQIPTKHRALGSACAILLQRITGRSGFEALAVAGTVEQKLLVAGDAGYDNQDGVVATGGATKRGASNRFLRRGGRE